MDLYKNGTSRLAMFGYGDFVGVMRLENCRAKNFLLTSAIDSFKKKLYETIEQEGLTLELLIVVMKLLCTTRCCRNKL